MTADATKPDTTEDANEGSSEEATHHDDRTPGRHLANWLVSLVVARDYGQLAELRRPGGMQNAHIRAGWYDPEHREIAAQVAFLFAIYHRGASEPRRGYGSLGAAACRIGTSAGQGPKDPGASRLMDRILAGREIPWRHLQHAVVRLRSCDKQPPNWAQLADELVLWSRRAPRRGERGPRIPYDWAVDFHAPTKRAPAGTTTKKDTAQ